MRRTCTVLVHAQHAPIQQNARLAAFGDAIALLEASLANSKAWRGLRLTGPMKAWFPDGRCERGAALLWRSSGIKYMLSPYNAPGPPRTCLRHAMYILNLTIATKACGVILTGTEEPGASALDLVCHAALVSTARRRLVSRSLWRCLQSLRIGGTDSCGKVRLTYRALALQFPQSHCLQSLLPTLPSRLQFRLSSLGSPTTRYSTCETPVSDLVPQPYKEHPISELHNPHKLSLDHNNAEYQSTLYQKQALRQTLTTYIIPNQTNQLSIMTTGPSLAEHTCPTCDDGDSTVTLSSIDRDGPYTYAKALAFANSQPPDFSGPQEPETPADEVALRTQECDAWGRWRALALAAAMLPLAARYSCVPAGVWVWLASVCVLGALWAAITQSAMGPATVHCMGCMDQCSLGSDLVWLLWQSEVNRVTLEIRRLREKMGEKGSSFDRRDDAY
ncbi:hypothetical protein BV25DRAFT_1840130 [Artomyces pyxidatus]|uniref:Uncharacterized protein n=1 Tax=Artomyces pyxidatus TaxID=48021 RepID=A0ACB8SU54_9AGAM|nr:hypothetical protein BV25DRAFT_1840130 [Artomyces pyxidatus]